MPQQVPVRIRAGQSLSDPVDLGGGYKIVGVKVPATWTAANLTFRTAPSLNGEYGDVYGQTGAEVSWTIAGGRSVTDTAGPSVLATGFVRFIQLRSGTSAAPVVQAQDALLVLMLRER